ncbi:MAG: hypothetical protein PF693_17475 [Spirochaetia bacterium]|jgi:hypothetical protein|nr:hypothetical protein [Spirochaetia bacterium]
MKNSKYLALSLIICFSLFIIHYSIFAVDIYETPISIISPTASALGGPHVTMNNGFSSLMNNPAGFYTAEPEFSIGEITLGLKGPVFDIANLIITNDMASLPAMLQGIYVGLDMLGPLSFGYVGDGLGFGIYSNSYSTISSSGPLTVKADIGSEVILTGGYAMRIPLPLPDINQLDVGMLLKGTFKGELSFEESALNIMNVSLATLKSKPFDFITGIGVDLGFRYSYKDMITFGLVGRDLYSPTLHNVYDDFNDFTSGAIPKEELNGIVPFALDFGMMYSPDLESKNLFVSDVKVYLDYYDILDFWLYPELATNPILHIGLGVEVSMLSILDVRAGFNEGLLAAGLGLDLYYFKLNLAMFGSELSTEPGLQPVYNLQLGFEFRI